MFSSNPGAILLQDEGKDANFADNEATLLAGHLPPTNGFRFSTGIVIKKFH
jgi:hypothetical protein